MLSVEQVTRAFGGIRAVDECSLDLKGYSVTGLIGPNGSGKTTLFNLITGLQNVDKGRIIFRDRRIDGLLPHERARHGLIRTFQLSRVFPKMTVMENMLLAPPRQTGESLSSLWFRSAGIRKEEKVHREKALELLNFMGIHHLRGDYAENLSYGQQKLLELGRALMADPVMILLDEPTAGINPSLIQKMIDMIRRLRDEGKLFFIIEHNMDVVIELCERVFVLDEGRKIAEGTPRDIQNDPVVIEAYLGV